MIIPLLLLLLPQHLKLLLLLLFYYYWAITTCYALVSCCVSLVRMVMVISNSNRTGQAHTTYVHTTNASPLRKDDADSQDWNFSRRTFNH